MSTEQHLPTEPKFPFIPVDGGYFDQDAALLRAEVRLRAEIAARVPVPPNPRSFVILADIA